jgi:hypothetical protein
VHIISARIAQDVASGVWLIEIKIPTDFAAWSNAAVFTTLRHVQISAGWAINAQLNVLDWVGPATSGDTGYFHLRLILADSGYRDPRSWKASFDVLVMVSN